YLAIALAAWASGRQDPRVRWVTLASLLSALFRLEWLLPLSAGLHHATVYLDHLALVALWPVLWLRPRQESLAKAS
ncbi:MAG TPA: hypothetical protein VK191_04135, partial [Symbiobacteriaceae bacterium]|nr:hypothetical protein [Symbiobacteriaceae bacterium]